MDNHQPSREHLLMLSALAPDRHGKIKSSMPEQVGIQLQTDAA
ncbi:hypothetical protein [Burkholderia sp. Bp8998]|nr:hypothetical protein [Burkholderia sp. Bp8998]